MPSTHQVVIQSALETGNAIGSLVARLGTSDNPSGRVLVAYRNARRALKGNLNKPRAVMEVLDELRRTVVDATDKTLGDAVDVGKAQAMRDLVAYGITAQTADIPGDVANNAVMAVRTRVDSQIYSVRASVLTGFADENLILGDDTRVGVLSGGGVISEASKWIAALTLFSYNRNVKQSAPADEFMRQAIAAIDERTTETCLEVNGQVVGMDEDFHLVGTPRYADYLRDPPFHNYCRTSVALVRNTDAKDRLTQEMEDAGQAELDARGKDGTNRVEIHPAHARSGR